MGASRTLKKKQPYYLIAFRILLALLWTQYTVLHFVRVIVQRLPVVGFLSPLVIPLSIILALIVAFPWFVNNVRGTDFAFYFSFVVLFFLTMVLFKNNADILEEQWWSILIAAVPFYFIGVSFPLDVCKKDLFWCSLVGVLCMFLYQLYKLRSGIALEDDNMYVAYNLLPSAIYLVYYAVIQNKAIYWVTAAGSAVAMFVFGTRGPILCILIFFIACLIYKNIVSSKKKKLFFWLTILLMVAVVFASDELFVKITTVLSDVFGKIGFSTRIFDFYLSGDAATSTGREYLLEQTIKAIIKNPITGYGLVGDQYLLGVYCHNLFIELWCQYGVILGTFVIIILAIIAFIALSRASRNEETFYFVLMLVCMVFIKLMLSSTYTVEPYFYFMLGVFVQIIRHKNINWLRYA